MAFHPDELASTAMVETLRTIATSRDRRTECEHSRSVPGGSASAVAAPQGVIPRQSWQSCRLLHAPRVRGERAWSVRPEYHSSRPARSRPKRGATRRSGAPAGGCVAGSPVGPLPSQGRGSGSRRSRRSGVPRRGSNGTPGQGSPWRRWPGYSRRWPGPAAGRRSGGPYQRQKSRKGNKKPAFPPASQRDGVGESGRASCSREGPALRRYPWVLMPSRKRGEGRINRREAEEHESGKSSHAKRGISKR